MTEIKKHSGSPNADTRFVEDDTKGEEPQLLRLEREIEVDANVRSRASGENKLENTDPARDEDGTYFESGAGDGTKATDQHLTGLALALTVTSCMASLFVAGLDQTIVTTILTEVGNKFDSFEKIGWLTSGYLLPMAALMPSYGKISIAFGRKYVLLVGLFIFMAGSLVSGLANSMDMLIGGRVIQGIGGGAITSMVSVVLTEAVPINLRPLLFMGFALTYSISSVLGPFIGGGFARVSWRWCFFINLPIGGIAAAMLVVSFHPPKPNGNFRQKLKKIDYLGSFLITSGLVLILLGLTFGGITFPWRSAAVILCFILGGLLLVGFGVWNFWYLANPILLGALTGNFKVMAPIYSGTFSYAAFLTLMTYLSTYFQIIHNASPWSSGVHTLPILISVCFSSLFSGVVTKKTRYVKPPLVFATLLGPIGGGLLLLFDVNTSTSKQIGLQIPVGISIGLQFLCAMLSSQLEAPNTVEGSVILCTVLLNFARSIAAAVAVTVGQLIFQTTGTNYITLLVNSLPKDSLDYEELSQVLPTSLISSPELIQQLNPHAKALVLKELMRSLKNIYYFVLALLIISFGFGLCATNKRIPKVVATIEKTPDEEAGPREAVEAAALPEPKVENEEDSKIN